MLLVDVDLGSSSDVVWLTLPIVEVHLREIIGSRVELMRLDLAGVEHDLSLSSWSVSLRVEEGATKLVHTLLLPVHGL